MTRSSTGRLALTDRLMVLEASGYMAQRHFVNICMVDEPTSVFQLDFDEFLRTDTELNLCRDSMASLLKESPVPRSQREPQLHHFPSAARMI